MRRPWCTIAAVTFALMIPSAAMGTERLPARVADALALGYRPACSLCHLKGNTGPGTASTPFALSMKARGLVGDDQASVSPALVLLDTDRVDSDGDGVTDVDELKMGADPNSPEGGVAASKGSGDLATSWPLLLAIAVVRAGRRSQVIRASPRPPRRGGA